MATETYRTDEPPRPGLEGSLAGRYTGVPWPRSCPRHTGTRRLCYTSLQHRDLVVLYFLQVVLFDWRDYAA